VVLQDLHWRRPALAAGAFSGSALNHYALVGYFEARKPSDGQKGPVSRASAVRECWLRSMIVPVRGIAGL